MSLKPQYVFDQVTGFSHPALYPGEKSDKWIIPTEVASDFNRLNSMLENKYTREYLKVCAFYNKMFPSLRYTDFYRASYNVQPFTQQDQEHDDTGTGVSTNYLKQIIDQVTSRLGTISFEPAILADMPTLEYLLYKDDVERILRKSMRDDKLNKMMIEIFHDAAILGYSHAFINPYTNDWQKANDWEISMYENQFNYGKVRQLLYRDYAFPTSEIAPYLVDEPPAKVKEISELLGKNAYVDFKMYFDCMRHEVYVMLKNVTLSVKPYNFDTVQCLTFQWDTGFSKVTSTSLFDLLYPTQREINKLQAKDQQLVRMYKGPVPVFSADVDLAMKAITNGTGEALYIDSSRPVDTLMSVINPTPLDSALDAKITTYKTAMYELSGLQQVSLDMENFRSAAAVIAMDQTRDLVFQVQVDAAGRFVRDLFLMFVNYNAVTNNEVNPTINWLDIQSLLANAYIDMKPVHSNDPMGNKNNGEGAEPADYGQIAAARFVTGILKGTKTWDDLTIIHDVDSIKVLSAAILIKMIALDIADGYANILGFLVQAFVEDMKSGAVTV